MSAERQKFLIAAQAHGKKISITVAHCARNAQPWRLSIACNLSSTVDLCGNRVSRVPTTHPLQDYSINFCLGRKNRLLGGFFISIRKSNKDHPVRLVDYQLSNNSVWTRKRITSDALVNACVALRHKHGNVKITLGDWK